jgi:exopolysaccharide biosynthesis WecB/TagA/CpsF family protein
LCGTDLIPSLIEKYSTKKVALIGTEEPFIGNAASHLKQKNFDVVLSIDGFRSLNKYLKKVQETKPSIIILGMGMPKQEKLAAVLKQFLNYPCLILNGGAIIDHIGGKVDRAPKWMRTYGLEWLFRLVQEPRRLFKRYVIGNAIFLKRVYKMTGRIKLR